MVVDSPEVATREEDARRSEEVGIEKVEIMEDVEEVARLRADVPAGRLGVAAVDTLRGTAEAEEAG